MWDGSRSLRNQVMRPNSCGTTAMTCRATRELPGTIMLADGARNTVVS